MDVAYAYFFDDCQPGGEKTRNFCHKPTTHPPSSTYHGEGLTLFILAGTSNQMSTEIVAIFSVQS